MIEEEIALRDKVSGPALKAASAVDKLGRSFERVTKANKVTAKLVMPKINKELKASTKQSKQATKWGEKLGEAWEYMGLESVTAGEVGLKALVGIVAAATTATIAIGATALALTKATGDADSARKSAIGLMNAYTGGRGAETLEQVDRMTSRLGLSIDEGREKFNKFLKETQSVKKAAFLTKLHSDIVAVTGDAGEADKAVAKIMEQKTEAGAEKALSKLRDKFGEVGSGALAAEKRFNTFEGALKRLKDAPARIFDKVAEKAGPKLDATAKKFSEMLDDIAESPATAKGIEAIVDVVGFVLEAVQRAAPFVRGFLESFMEGGAVVVPILQSVGASLDKAFGKDKTEQMRTVKTLARAIGVALGVTLGLLAMAVGGLVESWALAARGAQKFMDKVGVIGELPGLVGEMVAGAKSLLMTFANDAISAGKGFVDGLANGITSGISRAVAAVTQLGSSVTAALKGALQIKSPSRIGDYVGRMLGAGVTQGVEDSTSDAMGASAKLGAATTGGLVQGAQQTGGVVGGATSGASATLNLSLTVQAQPGATSEDGERMAEGIIPVIRREWARLNSGADLELGAPA